jgi:hypothetical protein
MLDCRKLAFRVVLLVQLYCPGCGWGSNQQAAAAAAAAARSSGDSCTCEL